MASRSRKTSAKPGPITAKNGQLGVNLRDFPVPDKQFAADYAWAHFRNGAIALSFAASSLGKERHVTSRLEVRMAVESFSGSILGPIELLLGGLQKFLGTIRYGKPRTAPEEWLQDATCPQELVAWASIARVAHVSGEAQLDFYQLTASQVSLALNGQGGVQFDVLPVVRVSTTSFELYSLLVGSREIGQQLGLMKAS